MPTDSSNATSTTNNTQNDDFMNSASPFFLHPNENPAIALASPILDGSNYHSWSRSMRRALISKNKYQFVTGAIIKPEQDDPCYYAWERCNNIIIEWISHSVSSTIAKSIDWIDNARDVWTDLQDRFTQGDAFRIAELQAEIYTIRQGDLTVNDYFTLLKSLWDELSNFRPIPVCVCENPCSCIALKTIKSYRETDCVICFLKGLNDRFNVARSQIMIMSPLPVLNKVVNLILQHERQLLGATGQEIRSFVNSMSSFENIKTPAAKFITSGKGKGNSKVCTHCHKWNHTIETCYWKHGFPPGFKFRNGKMPPGAFINYQGSVNNVAAIDSFHQLPTESVVVSPQASSSESTFNLTQEQYLSLIELLKQQQQLSPHSASSTQASYTPQVNSATTSNLKPHFTLSHTASDYQLEDDWYS